MSTKAIVLLVVCLSMMMGCKSGGGGSTPPDLPKGSAQGVARAMIISGV